MSMPRLAGAAVVALMAAVAAPAYAACEGGRSSTVMFSDSFDAFDPVWGRETDNFHAADGRMVIALNENGVHIGAPGYDWFEAYVCTSVSVTSGDPTQVTGGIVFWAQDADNYHAFLINGAGEGAVEVAEQGNYRYLMDWSPIPGLNAGVGAVNDLKVTIAQDQATLHVNGQAFRFLETSLREPRWLVGVMGVTFQSGGTFEFENFEIALPN